MFHVMTPVNEPSHVHFALFMGTSPQLGLGPPVGARSRGDPTLVPTELPVSLGTWAWEQLL